jgi:hypothetical protein
LKLSSIANLPKKLFIINLNENEVNKKDDKIKIKTKKRRINKTTGLTRDYDSNDPNINLENLFDN